MKDCIKIITNNGYVKKGYGWVNILGENTHWITLFDSKKIQMYAYNTEDEDLKDIYNTGVVDYISENNIQVLIDVLVK